MMEDFKFYLVENGNEKVYRRPGGCGELMKKKCQRGKKLFMFEIENWIA